jgi:hypothetical protein
VTFGPKVGHAEVTQNVNHFVLPEPFQGKAYRGARRIEGGDWWTTDAATALSYARQRDGQFLLIGDIQPTDAKYVKQGESLSARMPTHALDLKTGDIYRLQESRDDLSKLPLPASAKRYARMTSKTLDGHWSKKVDMYMDMAADLTNQSKEGYKNRDAFGKVPHSFAESVVDTLLESHEYRYLTNCVNCGDGTAINDMVDTAKDVSRQEFFRHVPLSELFSTGLGEHYAWTPMQCYQAGVDYGLVARNRGGLKWKNDWAIHYYKGTYNGQPCYFFTHSAIEYIFVKQ